MPSHTEWDAVVVGGGAAGLNAGIVLARTGVRVVIVEDRTPRNAPAAAMHGFLSREGMNPATLLQTGRGEVLGFGGAIIAAQVEQVRAGSDDTFTVSLGDGSELRAPVVLLASGLRDELPAIPGVRELWADLVHHCPHCHGREVEGQRIAILGGNNPAMSIHQAGLLRRYTDSVTFYPNGIELPDLVRAQLTAVGVVIADTPIGSVHRNDAGALILTQEDGEQHEHDCAFVAPVFTPRDEAFRGLPLARSGETPWIEHGPTGRTSVAGIWVAGNLANPRAQVITAAGEGSAAALDISGYLLERDLTRALVGEQASWYQR